MKKILAIISIALGFTATAEAIIVQKLYLKDGSVLSGYIQKQDDNGNLTFRSDKAEICLKAKEAAVSNERNYGVRELNDAWITWAEENDAFDGVGDNRTLLLADVTSKNRMSSRVKILERGEFVRYLEMTSSTYVIPWKDVMSIKGDKRCKTALSGINRIYQLKSGMEYEGQYAEENDSILTLYLKDTNVRQSFKINDVIKYTFRPINPNQDIFAQSELLDIVKTKNSNETKGVIIEQNYTSKKDVENYFLIQQESGAIQSIKLSDIVETRKEENPKYDPQFDILLKEGEVVINRQEVAVVDIQESNDKIVLDSISEKVVITHDSNNSTKVTVEYHNAIGANMEVYQLVKVSKSEDKKTKKEIYSFSYRDLVNAVYRPMSLETSVNNTTKAEYIVGGQGVYTLYDAKQKKGIPFIIK